MNTPATLNRLPIHRSTTRAQAGRSITPALTALAFAAITGATGWWLGQRASTDPNASPAVAAALSASGAAPGASAGGAAGAATGASAAQAGASGALAGSTAQGGPGGPANRRFGGLSRVQPVTVAVVRRQDVKVILNGIGNISALNTAVVRTRVEGELKAIRFTEGQMVRAGALLAEVDARSYEIALAQAQSQLAKDQATLKNAQLDLVRYKDLLAKDSIARQQVDTQEALVQQLNATLQSDQAQVDSAKLQLSYTKITAPIGGRLGLKQADLGNTVRPGDANGLVTITQTQPISVVFAMPEANLPQITRRLRGAERAAGAAQAASAPARPASQAATRPGSGKAGGPGKPSNAAAKPAEPLIVEAWDREQRNLLATGRVSTTDNVIDPVTGTIKLKAEFANADGALFPNQFVNVKLQINTLEAALAVPTAAIQRGAIGTFVYVVKPDNTVNMRRVRTGTTEGDSVSVTGELEAGERVVTDGADRLREGARVEVITPPPRFGAGGAGMGASNANPGSANALPPGPRPGASGPLVRRGDAASGAPSEAVLPPNRPPAGPAGNAPAKPPGDAGAPSGPVSGAATGAPAGAAAGNSAAWIDQLPPEAQERVRMVLQRLGPEVAAKVHKMTPEERRAFFQQLRARSQQQE